MEGFRQLSRLSYSSTLELKLSKYSVMKNSVKGWSYGLDKTEFIISMHGANRAVKEL